MTPLGWMIGATAKTGASAAQTAWNIGGAAVNFGIPAAAKMAYKSAPIGAKALMRSADWMWRHPTASVGLGIAGLGAYAGISSMNQSPTLTNARVQQTGPQQEQQMLNNARGNFLFPPGNMASASLMKRNRSNFQGSTQGLVQGLHRGRH